MNFTRLILTIISLFATATLLDSSSLSEVPGATGAREHFRISLAASTGALVDFPSASLEPLSQAEAREANLRAPFSTEQFEVASPLSLPLEPQWFLARASATDCLTAAIYYEAGMEAEVGKRAVAQVILNRVRHPAFPNSVCEVVMQGSSRTTGCQFTFTCDGSLYRKPSRKGWQSARRIALAALTGAVEPSVGLSTHYHADFVRPYWASSLEKVSAIGTHIFYRWSGGWGKKKAFNRSLALDREYDVARAVQWRSAASYLFDADMERADITSEAPEEHWQQSPSNIGSLPDPIRTQTPMGTSSVLRADQERGSLLVDEIGGTLIID